MKSNKMKYLTKFHMNNINGGVSNIIYAKSFLPRLNMDDQKNPVNQTLGEVYKTIDDHIFSKSNIASSLIFLIWGSTYLMSNAVYPKETNPSTKDKVCNCTYKVIGSAYYLIFGVLTANIVYNIVSKNKDFFDSIYENVSVTSSIPLLLASFTSLLYSQSSELIPKTGKMTCKQTIISGGFFASGVMTLLLGGWALATSLYKYTSHDDDSIDSIFFKDVSLFSAALLAFSGISLSIQSMRPPETNTALGKFSNSALGFGGAFTCALSVGTFVLWGVSQKHKNNSE